MYVVVDVVVERRVHALAARGADAVDLNHVPAEEQARRPLEQRAVAPRLPTAEHDLESAFAELERLAVAKDAVDRKVAAAHPHDLLPLGLEREGPRECPLKSCHCRSTDSTQITSRSGAATLNGRLPLASRDAAHVIRVTVRERIQSIFGSTPISGRARVRTRS
jgi:hypothetical protein